MAKPTTKLANHWSETPVANIIRPMQEFIQQSTSSGIVLIAAAVLALILANSPLADLYFGVLNSYMSVTIGPFELRETVLHWIN
ncbi:MAG: Na+/H+ antiporter NhaA, partial [Roseiflexaceae bacterium]|nr:Na+/H+ antiporter NhaA [Roseiflexaceae bacterium]